MKQVVMFLVAVMATIALPAESKASDFSDLSPSGHTLYYDTVQGYAVLTYPGTRNMQWQYYDNNSVVRSYTKPSGNVVIPDSVSCNGKWYFVRGIGEYAFQATDDVTSVSLPRTIMWIENSAFPGDGGNSSLNAVHYRGTLAEWSRIDFKGLYANPLYRAHRLFINNELVTQLVIPEGVDSVKNYAFIHMFEQVGSYNRVCYLDTIVLPSTLKYIGRYAFEWDYYPKHLYIPDSVVYIGHHAFNAALYGGVTLPRGLDTLREGTFMSCLFSEVTLPEGLEYIGNHAFYNCYNMHSIEIPASVQGLGNSVFSDQQYSSTRLGIKHIKFRGKVPPQVTPQTYDGLVRYKYRSSSQYDTLKIEVPCQSVDAYAQAPNWDTVAPFLQPAAVCIWEVSVAANNDTLGYVLGGGEYEDGQPCTLVAVPAGGVSFCGWQDGSMQNPRTIEVHSDTSFVALFATHDTTWLTVSDTTYLTVRDTTYLTIRDTTWLTVHDTTWLTVSDTTYLTVHDTAYLTVLDTTYLAVHDTTYLTVHDTMVLQSTLYLHDTVYRDVPYEVHDTVYVDVPVHDTTRIPVYVHDTVRVEVPYAVHDTTVRVDTLRVTDTLLVFDTVWWYDTVIVHDTVYVNVVGVGVEEMPNTKIYQHDGYIVVESADGAVLGAVRVFDVTGKMLASRPIFMDSSSRIRFEVSASGTYLVKIGDFPAKKIVVVR